MATLGDIITSTRYDLNDTGIKLWSNAELVEYSNRIVKILEGYLVSHSSDLLATVKAGALLATGNKYIAAPAHCAKIENIWISTVVSSNLDLLISAPSTITSVAGNFATDGLVAEDQCVIRGSTSNDMEIRISTISNDGAGTNNKIVVYNTTFTTEGAGALAADIIKIGTDALEKCAMPDLVLKQRDTQSLKIPYYFAHQGANIIFDSAADQTYGLVFDYYQGSDTLTTASTMPYNGEFDHAFRQALVMMARNRTAGEKQKINDIVFYQMFQSAAMQREISRQTTKKRWRLDF